jgi:hypothetical protein
MLLFDMGIIMLWGGVGDGICGIGSPASQMLGIKVGFEGNSGFRCSKRPSQKSFY